jgi:hypothetical protein
MTSISKVGRVDVGVGVDAVGMTDASEVVVVLWTHDGRKIARVDRNAQRSIVIMYKQASLFAEAYCGVDSWTLVFCLVVLLMILRLVRGAILARSDTGAVSVLAIATSSGRTVVLMLKRMQSLQTMLRVLKCIGSTRPASTNLRMNKTQPRQ